MTATTIPDHRNDVTTPTPSRRRRIAFRVLSIAMAATIGPLMLFGMTELVLMWLPGATVLDIVDDPSLTAADVDLHRVHFLSIGIAAAAFLPSLLVQLRHPARRLASISLLVAVPVLGAGFYAISGTLASWAAEELTMLVPAVLLAALHPRAAEILEPLKFDRTMGMLAGAAAIPWLFQIASSVQLQVQAAPGDSHAGLEHWATAALAAAVIIVASVLGASRRDGWRVPAGVAVTCTAILATHALVFSDLASSLPTWAAFAGLAWCLAYASAAWKRIRREAATSPLQAAPRHTASI